MKHPFFICRTVLVKNNNVEEAVSILNKVLGSEGVLADARRLKYYEKPWQTRRRVAYENCKAILREDFTRKLSFIMRKNRRHPYPGCY